MDTCRFQDILAHGRYIAPGETRTATGGTVIIAGAAVIQFCPYPKVDEEVDFICQMAKASEISSPQAGSRSLNGHQQYIRTWARNPFATASWLHYLLANCHPFDVSTLLFTRPATNDSSGVLRMGTVGLVG